MKNENIPMEKHGRRLIWHDEFTAPQIDWEKWGMIHSMNCKNRIYDNSEKHIRIEDNNLHMQIHRCGDSYSHSEGIATRYNMNFKYGYLEMRAKIPYRHCAWPGFWMLGNTPFHNDNIGWFAEIDIFEVFSNKNRVSPNLHKWGKAGHEMLPGVENNMERAYEFKDYENLNDEYHNYGFLWDEHEMSFWIDDYCYFKSVIDDKASFVSERYPTTEGFHEFMYVILNNDMFTKESEWLPEGFAATPEDPMPIDYRVDWIRLYQNPDTDEIVYADEIKEANDKKMA